MAIAVNCACGQQYQLKDDLAGKLVQCPACGASLRAEAPVRRPQADPAFDHDKFLLRQKRLSLHEKYYVWDEAGQTVLFIERPMLWGQTIAAILAAAFTAVFILVPAIILAVALQKSSPPVALILGILGVVIGLIAALAVGIRVSPKRHVRFYRDDSRRERLLDVLQDRKFWLLNATYTVVDPAGALLARLTKNYLYDIIRKRWVCQSADGSLLCIAREDSIILSMLRRLIGPMYGLLRTNFIIQPSEDGPIIGEFNRKFTLFDRYVLDLSGDPQRLLDRRVAIALGVMLDTGERR